MRTLILAIAVLAVPALAQSTNGIPRIMYDDISNSYWPLGTEDGSMIGGANGNGGGAGNNNNRSGLGDGTNPGQGGAHYSGNNQGTLNPGGLRQGLTPR